MAIASPPAPPAADEKARIRREMTARRDALAPFERAAAGPALARAAGLLAVPPGAVVSGFVPMRSEIDVLPLMEALAEGGAVTALPAIAGPRRLVFRRWRPGDRLVPARFGTREPPPEAEAVTPDTMLVPLLAFTAAGVRLGYGGGFYDTALAAASGRRPRAVGIAYACQEAASLPREDHDQPLDLILTESELIVASGSRRPL